MGPLSGLGCRCVAPSRRSTISDHSGRPTTATWRWLALAAVSAGLTAASLAAVLLSPVPLPPNLYIVGVLAFPVVGGLVVAHRPGNLIGRLLILVGAWNALGTAANTYVWMNLEVGPLPSQNLAAWLASWAFWPAFPPMAISVAVFPSGRLASRWLRWPLWVGSAAAALLTAAVMVLPVAVNDIFWGDGVRNPWGIAALAPLAPVSDLLPILVTVMIGLPTVDLVLRWRRAQSVERLQMRWVALGFMVVVVLGIAGLVTEVLTTTNELITVMLWLGFGALPAAIGVAVTQYRLFEIDRLVSRMVTYALLVATLVGVYAGGVILLRGLLPLQGDLAIAASTLMVAALFNPLRKRVQLQVDRRFNRSHYDAQQELERFAGRLRDNVELEGLTDDLLAVVRRTVQPSTATLWIRKVPPQRHEAKSRG